MKLANEYLRLLLLSLPGVAAAVTVAGAVRCYQEPQREDFDLKTGRAITFVLSGEGDSSGMQMRTASVASWAEQPSDAYALFGLLHDGLFADDKTTFTVGDTVLSGVTQVGTETKGLDEMDGSCWVRFDMRFAMPLD